MPGLYCLLHPPPPHPFLALDFQLSTFLYMLYIADTVFESVQSEEQLRLYSEEIAGGIKC